jgi:hypothetical protein
MAVLICLIFTCITIMLFTQGVYHAALNVTQIEKKYKGANPYLLHTRWENFKQLFGACSIWLFLPVQTVGSDTVGTSFPHRKLDSTASGHYSNHYGSVDSITKLSSIP